MGAGSWSPSDVYECLGIDVRVGQNGMLHYINPARRPDYGSFSTRVSKFNRQIKVYVLTGSPTNHDLWPSSSLDISTGILKHALQYSLLSSLSKSAQSSSENTTLRSLPFSYILVSFYQQSRWGWDDHCRSLRMPIKLSRRVGCECRQRTIVYLNTSIRARLADNQCLEVRCQLLGRSISAVRLGE